MSDANELPTSPKNLSLQLAAFVKLLNDDEKDGTDVRTSEFLKSAAGNAELLDLCDVIVAVREGIASKEISEEDSIEPIAEARNVKVPRALQPLKKDMTIPFPKAAKGRGLGHGGAAAARDLDI
jgi:hypothetical protein